MGTSLLIQNPNVHVEPGGTVATEIRVRNNGAVVDQFSFEPLGDAAKWITVDPPTLRLFPDTDAVATLRIAPPRLPTSRPGPTTWAVKALSQEDPGGTVVAEGTVDVGSYTDISAELQPSTARGRGTGRYELAVDNRGNVVMPVRVAGTSPDQELAFDIGNAAIDSAPGTATFGRLTVRPPRRLWRGQPLTHPFQVLVEPQASVDSAPPVAIVLNGTYVQQPIIPKWLPKALLIAAAALLALFVLWKTVLQPTVESAARAVAIEEVAPVSSAVGRLEPAVEDAAADAAAANEQAEAAASASEEAAEPAAEPTAAPIDPTPSAITEPHRLRLTVGADAGGRGRSAAEPLADGQSWAITDVILQNPGGDAGTIRVSIDGEVVLESALDNFRDLDFHLVAPFVVEAGQVVTVEVDCDAEQLVDGDPCADAVSISGFLTRSGETGA